VPTDKKGSRGCCLVTTGTEANCPRTQEELASRYVGRDPDSWSRVCGGPLETARSLAPASSSHGGWSSLKDGMDVFMDDPRTPWLYSAD
jgi:hypothetical protein